MFLIFRKQLETLRSTHTHSDSTDVSSLSSASVGSATSSGAQSLSGMSSVSAATNSNSSGQMGFLDELKKLAERRSSSTDGLLTDTLNKTKVNGIRGQAPQPPLKKLPIIPANDEKRKQHGKFLIIILLRCPYKFLQTYKLFQSC